MSAAENKLRAGDLVGANELFSKLIANDPGNFAGYAGRAATLAQKSLPAAIKDYKMALTLNPNATAVRVKYAALLLQGQLISEAVAQVKIALAAEPSNGEANRIAGICQARLGNYVSAIEPLRIALQANAGSPAEVCYYLYLAELHLKHRKEAAAYIDQALKFAPGNVRYLLDRARLKIAGQEYGSACGDLSAASKLSPLNAESRYLMGICAYEQRRVASAVDSWSEALNRGFNNPDINVHGGPAHCELGMFAEALQDLDTYLQFKPQSPDVLRRRNIAFAQVKQKLPAARTIATYAKSSVKQVYAYSGVDQVDSGYLALKAGDSHSAVAILSRAVKADPDNALARKYLAYAHLQDGNMDKAVSQFVAWNYLQAVPATEMWLFGKTMMAAGKYSQASQVFDDLVKAEPDNSTARVQLIKACALAGQGERARSLCLQAMACARDPQEYQRFRVIMP
mgnify:CR=1 FL=1